jgi:hypothetical protein
MNQSAPWRWEQSYLVFGHGVAASAAIAALPILAVLLLLGAFRKAAWIAGTVGLITALLVAIAGYRMPTTLALSAAAHGAAFGIFPISWIVFSAILLFVFPPRLASSPFFAGQSADLPWTPRCRRCSSHLRSAPLLRALRASGPQSQSRPPCSRAAACNRDERARSGTALSLYVKAQHPASGRGGAAEFAVCVQTSLVKGLELRWQGLVF